jgi:two-component system response regulator
MRQVPVVILTASRDDADVRQARELGASDYMVKPLDLDEYTKALADLARTWLG